MASVDGRAACKGLPVELDLSFAGTNHSTLRQQVTQVFELLRDPVYRYACRVLESPEQAEDLAQEVFLRLYAHLCKGGTVLNVRVWVFRVAHNLAIDEHRKRNRLGPIDPSARPEAHDPAPGADERILNDEQARRLQQALASLCKQERHCLELRAEGLPYREIADILEMRMPTLVKYLDRIIKKLVSETAYD